MGQEDRKSGGVRLLLREDFDRRNVFDQPLVGWRATSQGEGGLYNPRGFSAVRVVVQNPDGGDMYDQSLLVENLGSIVVPRTSDGKVGLVQSNRMVGERLWPAEPNYVARLENEGQWSEMLKRLGAWKWEVPRGISPAKIEGTFDSDADLALAAAQLEALQEAGFKLMDLKIVGRINPNSTFFAHPQFCVSGIVVDQQNQAPEDLEMIGKVKFFSATEIRQLVDSGELDDGLTKAALADAGFHY